MQSIILPVGVLKTLDRLIRSFLWGSSTGTKKVQLVNWDTVTLSKDNEGLGLKKLEQMNHAFMAKLGWRILQNENCLWIRLLKAKYSISSDDFDTWQPKKNMSPLWKGILRSRYILRKGIKRIVRNGKDTLFLLDTWLADFLLKEVISDPLPCLSCTRMWQAIGMKRLVGNGRNWIRFCPASS
ncbi:PREDICTED: uncharacterized protein LOC109174222 [Ipomoea nil]|uniref:uncharacterized protein LOC109174222 n=1 Tax=Ipomoea nil TaxID=35883 RepID=UPI00090125A3|nr:PREDICTED: uncharacterized protein LOC109174222 [Ipomoea nil]